MDEFICISCWKEFTTAHADVVRQQGKVICPNCGYILQVDQGRPAVAEAEPLEVAGVQDASLDVSGPRAEAVVLDWGSFSGDTAGAPAPEEPRPAAADAEDATPPDGLDVAVPPPLPEDAEVGFEDLAADEKTPLEPVEAPPSFELITGEHPATEGPVEWRLRTSSGLTFRFTDPDALLGWKKKINIYREMQVSPDGDTWVDYVVFLRRFESCGDAHRAFRQAGKTTAEILAPENIPRSDTALPPTPTQPPVPPAERGPVSAVPTTQFTFRTTDSRAAGGGKQVLLIIIGLALGAGAAWLALTLMELI